MWQVGHFVTGMIVSNRPDRQAYVVAVAGGDGMLALLPRVDAFREYRVDDGIAAVVESVSPRAVKLTQVSIHYFRRIIDLAFRKWVDQEGMRIRNIAISSQASFIKVAVEFPRDLSSRTVLLEGLETVKRHTNRVVCLIPFSTDKEQYIRNALLPARATMIGRCELWKESRHARVWVQRGQMSRVLGPKGMNVALAAKLVRYSIDVQELV